jgi:hypothetical protein
MSLLAAEPATALPLSVPNAVGMGRAVPGKKRVQDADDESAGDGESAVRHLLARDVQWHVTPTSCK